jgi:transcriptional regulator with XRE-family HTH domain
MGAKKRNIDKLIGISISAMAKQRPRKTSIGPKVRELRRGRRWTQSQLARRLGLSQARLSEIERGAGTFSAEQLIEILRLFNVPVSHFAPEARRDPDSELHNLLARLGAFELHESDALPSERIVDVNEAIRQTLVTGSARLVAALAPVLVRNANRVSLPRVDSSLRELGLDRRLPWLVENVIEALRKELPRAGSTAIEYRRALVVLETFIQYAGGRSSSLGSLPTPDILDETIRSERTLAAVTAISSPISQRWRVVTRLQPDDFAEALRGSRAGR